jgi:hypothetical protein
VEGSGSLNFKVLCRHLPGMTENDHEHLNHNLRSTVRDLNPGTPEDEGELLTTQPQRSVIRDLNRNNSHSSKKKSYGYIKISYCTV